MRPAKPHPSCKHACLLEISKCGQDRGAQQLSREETVAVGDRAQLFPRSSDVFLKRAQAVV